MQMVNLLGSYQHGLFIELIATAGLMVGTIGACCVLWKNPNGTDEVSKGALISRIVAGFGGTIIFTWLSVKSIIIDGGVYALLAHEEDAVFLEGVVQDVQEPSERFNFSGGGADVYVEDVEYYIWDTGKLKSGDFISFSYLPQNNMMLEYKVLSENNDHSPLKPRVHSHKMK